MSSENEKQEARRRLVGALKQKASVSDIHSIMQEYPGLIYPTVASAVLKCANDAVIASLIKLKPEEDLTKPRDPFGQSLLQRYLTGTERSPALMEVVHALVCRNDEERLVLRTTDDNERTALHTACASKRNISISIFQVLIEGYPEAKLARDKNGSMPMHLLTAANKQNSEVMKLLLDGIDCSEQILAINDRGNTTLHEACAGEALPSLPTLDLLLDRLDQALRAAPSDNREASRPAAAALKNRDGNTPLHLLCKRKRVLPLRAIDKLIRRFPQAARMKNELGDTPLHVLCKSFEVNDAKDLGGSQMTNAVKRVLMHFEREAAEPQPLLAIQNKAGDTPLHILCKHCHFADCIQMLMERHPQAAALTNVQGDTPLHVLCRLKQRRWQHITVGGYKDRVERAAMSIIRSSAAPAVLCSCSNKNGYTPLHLLVRIGRRQTLPWSLAKTIVQLMPDTAAVSFDERGTTVLHDVCLQQGVSPQLLRMIVSKWPVACLLLEYSIPAHVATASGGLEGKIPLDSVSYSRARRGIVEEATKEVACALVEMTTCPMCQVSHSAAEWGIQRLIPPAFVDNQCMDESNSRESISNMLARQELHDLANNASIQETLCQVQYQNLLRGMIQLRKVTTPRRRLGREQPGRAYHIQALLCVRDEPSCIYRYLRENPEAVIEAAATTEMDLQD